MVSLLKMRHPAVALPGPGEKKKKKVYRDSNP
jgi:hypothetical protein